MNEPQERYDFNANNVTGTYPIDEENDMVPIQLWREQEKRIEQLKKEIQELEDVIHGCRVIVNFVDLSNE